MSQSLLIHASTDPVSPPETARIHFRVLSARQPGQQGSSRRMPQGQREHWHTEVRNGSIRIGKTQGPALRGCRDIGRGASERLQARGWSRAYSWTFCFPARWTEYHRPHVVDAFTT